MKKLLSILIVLVTFTITSSASAQSAREIVDRALDRNAMGFQTGRAQITLKVQDQKGSARVRSLDVKSKEIDDHVHTVVTLTAPKDVRGQAFLFVERSGEDDVWMHLPAFKVTRRVEGGQKSGAFLGSHFTYADLESRDLREGEYERLPDEKIGSDDVYVVRSTPRKGERSDYTSVIVYVRKSDYIPLKIRFVGKGDRPVKTLFVEKLDKTSDGETYAKQMTLRPAGGGFTTLLVNALQSGADLPDSAFTRDALGK